MSYLIKIYHSYDKGKSAFEKFLNDTAKTLENHTFTLGLHYANGEIFYSLDTNKKTYPPFESQFYTHFNDFQIVPDEKNTVWAFNKAKTVIGELKLENSRFYPFLFLEGDGTEFMSNMFRSFENFDVAQDKIAFFLQLKPINTDSAKFSLRARWEYKWFRHRLRWTAYKYWFNSKIKKGRQDEGHKYFEQKKQTDLYEVRMYFVVQAESKASANGKVKALYNNFLTMKNFPLNQFVVRMHTDASILTAAKTLHAPFRPHLLTPKEIANFFHFPKNPKSETSLLTVKARKLALPVGVPTFSYDLNEKNEVIAKDVPRDVNIIGVSDYRSIRVPIGIYDEDRLRHVYVIGKTGTGKSKFFLNLMVNDVTAGKGMCIIDPHGDVIEELMMHIPSSRADDVIIFDPTDDQFPFCLNPLDVKEGESKQVLAKGFIDIFNKFFGANWNSKLEHVLRMIFLALLDKKDSTLFDIIRALTDKDFRYTMIDQIQDDVVRNFRTNEFAGRSQQFNTEAIMPILNKVGQLLSIDILKNIFASPTNKLDFRECMDKSKILLVKLPKGKLQEEIMGFLGAMFVTKIFQTAMGRQSVDKSQRTPFFLYVDEFQNFATDTFSEILAEARKYGLSLAVAHQFVKQIPPKISDALFGNVGTMISFRVSSDDAEYIKNHFSPFVGSYDLANLNMREFYCKLLVKGQVKDPFSLKSSYMPDTKVTKDHVMKLYEKSRAKYNRTLEEAKKVVAEEIKDVEKTLEEFNVPII